MHLSILVRGVLQQGSTCGLQRTEQLSFDELVANQCGQGRQRKAQPSAIPSESNIRGRSCEFDTHRRHFQALEGLKRAISRPKLKNSPFDKIRVLFVSLATRGW